MIVFIDESGVLRGDRSQPYFGIGALTASDARTLANLVENTLGRLSLELGTPPGFELKFSALKPPFSQIYEGFYEALHGIQGLHFEALYVDRREFRLQGVASMPSAWKLHSELTRQVLDVSRLSEDPGPQVVLADEMMPSKAQPFRWEQEVMRENSSLPFAAMVRSARCLPIQACDVLLGSCIYQLRLSEGLVGKTAGPKASFAARVVTNMETVEATCGDIGGMRIHRMRLVRK